MRPAFERGLGITFLGLFVYSFNCRYSSANFCNLSPRHTSSWRILSWQQSWPVLLWPHQETGRSPPLRQPASSRDSPRPRILCLGDFVPLTLWGSGFSSSRLCSEPTTLVSFLPPKCPPQTHHCPPSSHGPLLLSDPPVTSMVPMSPRLTGCTQPRPYSPGRGLMLVRCPGDPFLSTHCLPG